jgi:hypothetical protein
MDGAQGAGAKRMHPPAHQPRVHVVNAWLQASLAAFGIVFHAAHLLIVHTVDKPTLR